jgi:hypothetical protein
MARVENKGAGLLQHLVVRGDTAQLEGVLHHVVHVPHHEPAAEIHRVGPKLTSWPRNLTANPY